MHDRFAPRHRAHGLGMHAPVKFSVEPDQSRTGAGGRDGDLISARVRSRKGGPVGRAGARRPEYDMPGEYCMVIAVLAR